MWCIINWYNSNLVNVVTDEDVDTMLFESRHSAELYAKEELNFNWVVVELKEGE